MRFVLSLLLAAALPNTAFPKPGQTFLFLAPNNTDFTLAGKTLPLAAVYGKVFRLGRREGNALVFEVEGVRGEVRARDVPAALAPLIEDDEVRALRRDLIGKTVWTYGRLPLECRPENDAYLWLSGAPEAAIPVRGVWRLDRPRQVETRGFPGGGPYVKVARPLVLRFGRTPALQFTAAGMSGDTPHLPELLASPACQNLTGIYAGERQLTRLFSRTMPPADVTATGRRERGNLLGLTKIQVLWRIGPPDLAPGAADDLLGADEWRWSNLPGLGDGVVTFENGKVARENWPRLP